MIKKEILKTIIKLFDKFLNTELYLRLVSENNSWSHKNSYETKNFDLIFVHVPKTGGTTFNYLIDKLKVEKKINVKNRGHFSVSINSNISDNNYCTVIRNPIERSISYFNTCLNDRNNYSHHLAKKGFDVFMRRCFGVQNIFCKYYSGYIDDHVTDLSLKKAFENLKQFKHIILFEDIENDLKKFINENNLDIKSIPNIDYNSTKKNYDNYDFKKIAEFYNPYDLILYKRVKEEILKKL